MHVKARIECIKEEGSRYAIIIKKSLLGEKNGTNTRLNELIHKYHYLFSDDLALGLPPKRGIDHIINLMNGAFYLINSHIDALLKMIRN